MARCEVPLFQSYSIFEQILLVMLSFKVIWKEKILWNFSSYKICLKLTTCCDPGVIIKCKYNLWMVQSWWLFFSNFHLISPEPDRQVKVWTISLGCQVFATGTRKKPVRPRSKHVLQQNFCNKIFATKFLAVISKHQNYEP